VADDQYRKKSPKSLLWELLATFQNNKTPQRAGSRKRNKVGRFLQQQNQSLIKRGVLPKKS